MKFIYSLYTVVSALLILILNNYFMIFRQPYSFWLVPLLLVAFVLVFVLLQFAILVIAIWLVDKSKSPERVSGFIRYLINVSLPLVVKLARVKINTSGLEKLTTDRKMLFVCNHQHDFDPVVMFAVFPDSSLGFIGKKEIYETRPFISRAMHAIYSLPIDRENDREAAKTIIKAIKTIKDDTASIALFPEGYTSKSCELLPFRNGSFKIALKARCPVAVCVINNTREIPKNIFRRKTEVEFRLLDVIFPEQFESMNTNELGELIHSQMAEALREIRQEV